MDDLQTDTLSDYVKNQNPESTDLNERDTENACTANLLNGCDDIDDPLDLMDHCDNASIGSNSDIWKGSDSEDECFENKDNSRESLELNKNMSADVQSTPIETAGKNEERHSQQEEDTDQSPSKEDTSVQEPGSKDVNEEETENVVEDEGNGKTSDNTEGNEDSHIIESENQSADPTDEKETTEETQEKSLSPVPSNETGEQPGADKEEKELDSNDNNQKESNEVDAAKESQNVDEKTAEDVPGTEKFDELQKDPLNNENADKESPDNEVSEVIEKDPLADDDVSKETTATCTRRPDRNNEGQEDEDSQMDYNDDDDDFDPSLLCPEVSMAVDENPVITNCGPAPNDENASPLSFEPVFSTFVDEVTGAEISFNLTAEEQELRKRLYGPTNPVQYSKIHCTACNVHLGSALEGQSNRFVHPLLKVLICKECYHFYTSGEFEKDEDGSELYCRWCGQGGQVLCCSKCEFVFCKRCIRTNFGRRKMFEIRDSDSWDCFRCAPSQIITQRVACFEFFEYVRREMARAATLKSPEVWSKDHTHCCLAKKRSSDNAEEVKKPKRKRGEVDPDYTPLLDVKAPNVQNPPFVPAKAQTFASAKGIVLPKQVQMVPRLQGSKDNDIEFVRHIPAPQVALNPVKTNAPMPVYRTILPSTARPVLQSPAVVRINSQSLPPLVPTASRLLGSALQGQRTVPPPTMMKHEWFEKTVRAAARVNSHLSYTLTQLNKAQSQAASVEELAVVHNKLQEILSSSINSLIQIRKNLRTEFIAGIKTVRLPSKKATETFNNDDDVIFVSAPTTMPMPSLTPCPLPARTTAAAAAVAASTSISSISSTSSSSDPIIIIDNSTKAPSLSEERKEEAAAAAAKVVSTDRPRLKVKSMSELQNVPSECITIPDDAPAPKVDEVASAPEVVVCNGTAEKCKTPEADNVAPTPDGNGQKPMSSTPTPDDSSQKTEPVVENSPKRKKRVNSPAFEKSSKKTEPVIEKSSIIYDLEKTNGEKTESASEKNIQNRETINVPVSEKGSSTLEKGSKRAESVVSEKSSAASEKSSPTSEKSSKKAKPPSEKKNVHKTESVRSVTPDNNSSKTEPPMPKLKLEIDLNEQNVLETRTRRSKVGENRINSKTVYNIKDEPSGEIKRMLSVTVNLPRIDLEKLQKRLPNGCH